ncbi:hypothetical protein B0H13DRAFT_1909201 [Mycena leptocephala]|nr:hypothetical protein B0H13DRAFT_1909201 [Mycena leptocephala]
MYNAQEVRRDAAGQCRSSAPLAETRPKVMLNLFIPNLQHTNQHKFEVNFKWRNDENKRIVDVPSTFRPSILYFGSHSRLMPESAVPAAESRTNAIYHFSFNKLASWRRVSRVESGTWDNTYPLGSQVVLRQTIDALFRCGLSVGYDSVLNLVQSLGDGCTAKAAEFAATEPRGLGYDNMNISTSIFVEQRGANGPAKVTSGTFGVLYGLRNAKLDHMLIAPIMKRFRGSTGFEDVAKHPTLQHKSIRPLPVGYKTPQFATRASTKEEATTRGNLQCHDELYITQLKRTPESLNKYAIPSINDQLTNSRIRSAQFLRLKDVNAWERREILQLGFGLFHLCLNLVWAILHTHRGSTNEMGSLTYFFALMEKARLGNDQPDYHSLLAALTQVLHGLLLNAWSKECGSPESGSAEEPAASDDSSESESGSEAESTSHLNPPPAPADNPKDDVAYHNIRLLTRDLLVVTALVRAISDGDIGRVEAMLPHLAMMFRGSGCNKYCTEILHFLHNLKHVWTPEFADIMRDNMIIYISGGGPGHCLGVDLNIEHLIGYLKILLQAKGMNSTWDRLGNMSAAIVHLQRVKKKIAAALNSAHTSAGHTTPETSHLVWRVQRKVSSEKIQQFDSTRSNNTRGKLTKDISKGMDSRIRG